MRINLFTSVPSYEVKYVFISKPFISANANYTFKRRFNALL